ncbi:hypothetical protein CPC16_000372 [Podila verticillata]|nr:hypothetical protein CPC16_000372 [Podila verticillata]
MNGLAHFPAAMTTTEAAGYAWAGPMMGWFFLPKMAASVIQNMWYRTMNSKKRPAKDSSQYKRHFAWIFAGVVITYLSYTIIQFERALGSNHYNMMELQFSSFTQKQLKTNFRKASLQYHPDKIGDTGAGIFVKIREAHEVLVDPILRVAYDRFGPEITACPTCKTTKDYVKYGINDFRAFYSGSYALLFLLGMVGKAGYGRYWRYVALTYMAAWEFSMLVGPKQASFVSYVVPHRTTYEQTRIVRQIFVSVFVAINQIGPHFLPSTIEKKVDIKDVIKKASELNDEIIASSVEQLQDSFDVFRDDAECMTQLRRQMIGVLTDSLIAASQPVFDDARMTVYKRIKNPLIQQYYDEKRALSRLENI